MHGRALLRVTAAEVTLAGRPYAGLAAATGDSIDSSIHTLSWPDATDGRTSQGRTYRRPISLSPFLTPKDVGGAATRPVQIDFPNSVWMNEAGC